MFEMSAVAALLSCLGAGTAPRDDPSSFVCGPRCVQRVLQHYGQQAELIDLVRELQGAAIDRPANLADMKRAIQRRGICAEGVRIAPADLRRIMWPEPVIAHLSGTDGAAGHFCVLPPAEPGPGASSRIWDGLGGSSELHGGEAFGTFSGVVLVTARSPISEVRGVLRPRRPLATAALAAVLAACAAIARGLLASAMKTRGDCLRISQNQEEQTL